MKYLKIIKNGIIAENPTFVLLLGIRVYIVPAGDLQIDAISGGSRDDIAGVHDVACRLVLVSQIDLQFTTFNFVFISDDEVHVVVRTLFNILEIDAKFAMGPVFGNVFHKKVNDGALRLYC